MLKFRQKSGFSLVLSLVVLFAYSYPYRYWLKVVVVTVPVAGIIPHWGWLLPVLLMGLRV